MERWSVGGGNYPSAPISNATAVSAGDYHTLALTRDATVVAWGYERQGNLNAPKVLRGVVAVAGGEDYSLALGCDGRIVPWGGYFGQVGLLPDLTNVVSIASRYRSNLALRSDGTVFEWGTDLGEPFPADLRDVVAIAAGAGHKLALKRDGTVVASKSANPLPTYLSYASALAGGNMHSLAVRHDGSLAIIRQPMGCVTPSGRPVLISVGVVCIRPVNYEWRFNGQKIEGATNSTLRIDSAKGSDSGLYDVRITAGPSSLTSSTAELVVLEERPSFLLQPLAQQSPEGVDVSFSIETTGSSPTSYQWRLNGVDLVGQTNTTLLRQRITPADEGNYSVLASNAFGVTLSSNAFLDVITLPEALNAPLLSWARLGVNSNCWIVQRTVRHDGFAAVELTFRGNPEPTVLQTTVMGPGTLKFWRLDGLAALSVAINGVLTTPLEPVQQWQEETFYLPAGPQVLSWIGDSRGASAYLDEVSFTPGATPPVVTFDLTNAIAVEGADLELRVAAIGTPPLSYQWHLNGLDVPAATNEVLILNNVGYDAEGTFSVKITSQYGTAVSKPAFVDVIGLGEALNSSLVLVNDAARPWFVQTNVTHDGTAALQSGPVGANERSTLSATVQGPGRLSFWWLPSGELDRDFAIFSIDGNERARVTGYPWKQETFFLAAGSHQLTWEYVNNQTLGWYREAAWLDEVLFEPGGTPPAVFAAPAQWAPVSSTTTLAVQADGTPQLRYQWQFKGVDLVGATEPSIVITNVQNEDAGDYVLLISNDYGSTSVVVRLTVLQVAAWGAGKTVGSFPEFGQSIVPASATNVIAISASLNSSTALTAEGKVVTWGSQQAPAPAITNAVSIAAGDGFGLALLRNGRVQRWGSGGSLSPAFTNITAIAAGAAHVLGLRSDGTVLSQGQPAAVPQGLSNVVAVAAGSYHSLALRADGTVAGWGANNAGQAEPPPGLTGVIAIAVGTSNSLALKANGQVVGWGDNRFGQTNLPAGLQNVVSIAAGYDHCLALTEDGTLYAWGDTAYGKTTIPFGLTNVAAMACGKNHSLTLMIEDGWHVLNVPHLRRVALGESVALTPVAVGVPPVSYQWQHASTNIAGATGPLLFVDDARPEDGGVYTANAGNLNGSHVSSNLFLEIVDLAGSLDATNLTWTTFGPDSWVPTTSLSRDGEGCAMLVTTNVTGCGLQTVVTGPGALRFWWLAGKARLTLMVDGVVRATGGSFGAQVLVYVPVGKHVLTWTGNREGWAAGSVTAFVDAVTWTPGGTAPIMPTTAATNVWLAGISAGLSVSPNGTSPFEYQWLLNGAEIPFATNSTLSFTNAQAEDQGVYSVVVSNPWGSVTRSNLVVEVTPSAPVLLAQPYHTNRLAGLPFLLAVSARGSSPIIYRWKRNGELLAMQTNSFLTFTNPQVSDSAGYTVEVSNALGSTNTANAIVRVYVLDELAEALNGPGLSWTTTASKPWFSQTNVTHDGVLAAQGHGDASLETIVTGPAVVSFWWRCSGTFTTFEASVGGLLQASIKPTADWQPGTVYVPAGSQTVQWKLTSASSSDPAWLDQVQITPGGVPVTITKAPSDVAASAGRRIALQVVASGTPPFNYQWQLNGKDIAGATDTSILIDAQASTEGTYTVVVSNDYGPPASASAGFQVNPAPPSISAAWTNMARSINGTADFEVSAVGSEPLAFQWFFNGAPRAGATNPVLRNLRAEDAGNYQIVVTNGYGSATSAVLRLVVHQSTVVDLWSSFPRPAQVLDISNVVAIAAGTKHTAAIKSDGSVIAWGDNSLRQTEVPEGLQNVVSLAAGDNHTVALGADGKVVCWGDNRFGQLLQPEDLRGVVKIAAARNHTLVLKADGTLAGWGEPTGAILRIPEGMSNVVDITTIPHDGFVLKKDGTVSGWFELSANTSKHITNAVQVGAAGYNSAYNSYILKDDGVLDTFYWAKFPVQTPGVIAISAAPYTNNGGGTYVISLLAGGDVQLEPQSAWQSRFSLPRNLTNAVSVSAGQNHAAVLLNDGSPFVSRSLLDKMVVAGSRVVFYPGISGQQPMSYQWYHEGQPVSGGTNLTLVIDQVRSGAAGLYFVAATNTLGTVTTRPARLTVVDAGLLLSLSMEGTPSPGLVRLVISGLSGRGPAVIYSSEDLVQWQPVWTNAPVSGMVEFIDTPASASQKFYRVVEE